MHAAKADDVTLVAALNAYHRENCSNNDKISKRLLAEHQITMRYVGAVYDGLLFTNGKPYSATTVKRRRKELGLTGSGVTTREMLPQVSEQLVLNKMDKDPGKWHGVRTIRQKVAHEDGVQLTRYNPPQLHTFGSYPLAGLVFLRLCTPMIEMASICVSRPPKRSCDFQNFPWAPTNAGPVTATTNSTRSGSLSGLWLMIPPQKSSECGLSPAIVWAK